MSVRQSFEFQIFEGRCMSQIITAAEIKRISSSLNSDESAINSLLIEAARRGSCCVTIKTKGYTLVDIDQLERNLIQSGYGVRKYPADGRLDVSWRTP